MSTAPQQAYFGSSGLTRRAWPARLMAADWCAFKGGRGAGSAGIAPPPPLCPQHLAGGPATRAACPPSCSLTDPAIKLDNGAVVSGPSLAVEVNGLKMPNPFVIGSGPPGTNYQASAAHRPHSRTDLTAAAARGAQQPAAASGTGRGRTRSRSGAGRRGVRPLGPGGARAPPAERGTERGTRLLSPPPPPHHHHTPVCR